MKRADDANLLERVTADVHAQMNSYVDPAKLIPRTALVGSPKPDQFFDERISEMRSSLIEPYWLDVEKRDCTEEIQRDIPIVVHCLVLTCDEGDLRLAFCPSHNEYLLIQDHGDRFTSIGVWGDAVGCYAAI